MSPSTTMFLLAALVTATVTCLIVNKMADQLKQTALAKRRVSSILVDLPGIIREHNRLYPQSGPMLAFWLSVIFLLVWLSCIVFTLARHL